MLSARQGLLLKRVFDSLPNPIHFEGSVGDGGTISELYTPSEDNKGAAYYVVTAGVYDGQEAEVKDFFVCNGSEWILIKNTESSMDNFYTKSEVQSIISGAVSDIVSFDYSIVDILPSTGVKGTIFLVPNSEDSGNIYDEYLFIGNDWEKIGTTDIDLSYYYTKSEVNTKLSNKQDKFTINGVELSNDVELSDLDIKTISGVYSEYGAEWVSEVLEHLYTKKQDKLTAGTGINIANNNISVGLDKFTRVVNKTNFEVWVNTQYVQVILKGTHAITTSWVSLDSTALSTEYRPKTNIIQPIGITTSRQNYFQVTSAGLVQIIGTSASSSDNMRGAVMYPKSTMY